VAGLAGGYEFRRGYNRLQAFYGGEAAINYYNSSQKYEYGNDFSATNLAPTTTTDFASQSTASVASRTLEMKTGGSVGFGLGAFFGVEYFIAPKISIGGELGLGLAFKAAPKGETTTETWDAVNNQVKETTVEQYSASDISGFKIPGQHFNVRSEPLISHNIYYALTNSGNIFILFHF
jgi:hypothetical protein